VHIIWYITYRFNKSNILILNKCIIEEDKGGEHSWRITPYLNRYYKQIYYHYIMPPIIVGYSFLLSYKLKLVTVIPSEHLKKRIVRCVRRYYAL